MNKPRTLALVTGLSLLLAACTGTKTPSAVTTVEVTAPSNLNVKLNDAATTTRFSAVARASDGTALTGKTVTWTSSNPDVATVDANGVVTAKHFGETIISAKVDGVAGNKTATLRTYGLEAFVGERDTQYDTAMFFRYRTATGTLPSSQKLTITVNGPAGWNGDQPYVIQKDSYFFNADGSGSHWFEFDVLGTAVKPVIGAYKVQFDLDGQQWTSSTNITSFSNSSRNPTNITATVNSSTSVTAAWDDVVPDGSYDAEVVAKVPGLPDKAFYPPDYVNEARTVLDKAGNNVELVAGTNYFVRVHAFSLDITAPVTTILNGQFDVMQSVSPYFRL